MNSVKHKTPPERFENAAEKSYIINRCVHTYTRRSEIVWKRHFCRHNLSMVSKRIEMKTERLPASCQHKRRYFFVPLLQTKHLSLKTAVNSNAFRWNFFALFEIFWVYTSASLICKQTVTAWCEHT